MARRSRRSGCAGSGRGVAGSDRRARRAGHRGLPTWGPRANARRPTAGNRTARRVTSPTAGLRRTRLRDPRTDRSCHREQCCDPDMATQHATLLGAHRSGRFMLSDLWLREDGGKWRGGRRHSTPASAIDGVLQRSAPAARNAHNVEHLGRSMVIRNRRSPDQDAVCRQGTTITACCRAVVPPVALPPHWVRVEGAQHKGDGRVVGRRAVRPHAWRATPICSLALRQPEPTLPLCTSLPLRGYSSSSTRYTVRDMLASRTASDLMSRPCTAGPDRTPRRLTLKPSPATSRSTVSSHPAGLPANSTVRPRRSGRTGVRGGVSG